MNVKSSNEEWRPIHLGSHFDVQFHVSSWGRIRSDPYSLTTPCGWGRYVTRTFIVQPTYGHANKTRVNYKFRKKNYKIHQLVCEAFHGPKPFSKAMVLHIDEDFTNNNASNLEWGTSSMNASAPSLKEWYATRPRYKGQFVAGEFK